MDDAFESARGSRLLLRLGTARVTDRLHFARLNAAALYAVGPRLGIPFRLCKHIVSRQRAEIAQGPARILAHIRVIGAGKPSTLSAPLRWPIADEAPKPEPLPMWLIPLRGLNRSRSPILLRFATLSSFHEGHEASMKHIGERRNTMAGNS